MSFAVRELASSREALDVYLSLTRRIYRGDPSYCAPFKETIRRGFERPEFDGCQQFLVVEDRSPIAFLVARRSPTLVDASGRPVGVLGAFEAFDNRPAVRKLFLQATERLRQQGVGQIIGPMDGDTWHSYRLSAGPFDEPPFLMEPYNPRYYAALWEENSFRVLESYYSMRVDDAAGAAAALEAPHQGALEAGYTIETLRMDCFASELDRLYALSCRIFRENFLYSEISKQEFTSLYAGARKLIDPELVFFAIAPDGEDAGFLFALSDRRRAVAAMRGKTHLLAMLRFLALRGQSTAINLKSLGVVPEHRRSGIGAALMYSGYAAARRKGCPTVNLCLILDGNPSGRLDCGLGTVTRRYHLYEWAG